MAIALCFAAFLVSFAAGRVSRVAGLVATIGIGYVYGIVRANVPETFSHFIFDAAVLGFYVTQFSHHFSAEQERKVGGLKAWVQLLALLPLILFFIPNQDWLVRLVGLRASIFLLPFLFIGAWLEPEERYKLALSLAGLNILALAFAVIQFFVGVEPFFPRNEVTYLIYKSRDLVGYTAYRIPSFFNNSHSYAGAITVTLPLLIGALIQKHKSVWAGKVLALALGATLLGIFLTGARSPVVIAGIIIVVATFSLRSRLGYAAGWLMILLAVGWIVSGEERLQRFTLLADTDAVVERLSGSVNMGFVEMARNYPFGNGLGGGGTSMPYWMQRQIHDPVVMENEYGRIMLEQGILGLAIWIAFLIWALAQYVRNDSDKWSLGRKLAWVTCATFLAAGVAGTGTFTAIPQTCLLLLLIGWMSASQPVAEPSKLYSAFLRNEVRVRKATT
jgi:hypothetical protein